MSAVRRLGDHVGNQWALALCLALSSRGFVTPVAARRTPLLLFGIVRLGVGISYGGAVQSLFMSRFDCMDRISGFGTVRTVYVLLGSLALSQGLADTFGRGFSYRLVAVFLGVMAVTAGVWTVWRTQQRTAQSSGIHWSVAAAS